MKVCTDACILGALAEYDRPLRIIDIGAGTGLLSLMLAQRYQCPIDAVEIYPPSCEEALINIQNSPWGDRVNIFCQRIQDFSTDNVYDLIISNPPFYHGQKKADAAHKNLALHGDELPLSDLVKVVLRLMSPDGKFFVLLPPTETSTLTKMMRLAGANLAGQCRIRNSPGSAVFREVTSFSFKNEIGCAMRELCIRDNQNEYSDDFINLLSPYYLNF
jgi:tRNA1Val (adenine37-N6)-methyltransferase